MYWLDISFLIFISSAAISGFILSFDDPPSFLAFLMFDFKSVERSILAFSEESLGREKVMEGL